MTATMNTLYSLLEAARPNFCLNGRAFVGNTPTVVGDTGERLRWYIFNLDVSGIWHNFHPHSVRWTLPAPPGGASDVHGMSSLETFITDTEIPPAMRLPHALEQFQCESVGKCLSRANSWRFSFSLPR